MKRILVIAEGALAQKFINRIVRAHPNDNVYDIVSKHPFEKESKKIYCRNFYFDPTSRLKLSKVVTKNHLLAIVILQDKEESIEVYRNLRRLHAKLQIILVDLWDIGIKDDNLSFIDANSILANRLFSMLPDVPVFAQQVGFGKGEIMEARVPFGSGYAYRHISNIEQKQWRIGAIYRKDQILLPKHYLMIRPNDVLLLIGQPSILKDVYRAIKLEHGQFPAPYGKNIYHIIDMKKLLFDEVKKEIEDTIYLTKRLKNHLTFIKIINANDFRIIEFARNLKQGNIEILIEYNKFDFEIDLSTDIQKLNIGLIVVNRLIFGKKVYRRLLHSLKKPVLKLGNKDIKKVDKSAILLNDNTNLENISSAIFDISTQLALKVGVYDIDPEGTEKGSILEHFENLAEIYSKQIDIIKNNKNPLREMVYIDNFLQFIPFTKDVANASLIDMFFPNIEKMYQFLDDYNQIFIPVL